MRLKSNIRIHSISVLSVICAVAFVIIALTVRVCTGSPYKIINYCGLEDILPSVWIMVIMWCLWYVILGITFGAVIGCKGSRNEVNKYKGGMIFVIMIVLGYVWYPLFFGSASLFFALLICEAVFVLAILCVFYFRYVNRGSAWVMTAFSLWMLWMVILNITALLNC